MRSSIPHIEIGLRSRIGRRLLAAVLIATMVPLSIAALLTFQQQRLAALDLKVTELGTAARFVGHSLFSDLLVARDQLALLQSRRGSLPPPLSIDAAHRTLSRVTITAWSPEQRRLDSGVELNRLQVERLLAGRTVLWLRPPAGPTHRGSIELARYDPVASALWVGEVPDSIYSEYRNSLARDARIAIVAPSIGIAWAIDPALQAVVDGLGLVNESGAVPDDRELLTWTHDGQRYEAVAWGLFLHAEFAAEPLRIVFLQPGTDVGEELGPLTASFPLLLIAASLIAVWLTTIAVRRYVEPLHALSEATTLLAKQRFGTRLPIRGDDELANLAGAFNSMASELQSQFDWRDTLAAVDRLLLESRGLEPALQALLPRVARASGASAVGILLPDQESGDHGRIYGFASSDAAPRPVARVRVNWATLASALGDRAKCPFADIASQIDESAVDSTASLCHRSQVWALRVDGQLNGLLCVRSEWGEEYEAPRMMRVADLADRIMLTMRNTEFTRQLYEKGHFDSLTGLPNRRLFVERVDEFLLDAQQQHRTGAMLYLDFDGFKQVNDLSGHMAGDRMLEIAAARMRTCLGLDDVLARLGGDEFAILLTSVHSAEHVVEVASRLHAVLAQGPRSHEEGWKPMTTSIGVCMIPADGSSTADLLKHSDIAMYRAKESGRGRTVFFAREMHERMQQRASIEDGLRSAIANGELELHYQPIIHRGQIISAEGLLRWTTAAGERISPATFIPVAEDSGLIREIGIWVVNEACRHLAAWKAQDIAPPFLSINVAPEQLRDDWFVSRVAGALRRFSIDPSWLQIEITESAIADGALASMRLRELSEVGVRIALDDFGAGYSSLSTLQTLPIDVIKIDRSFITKVPQSLSACRLIEAIVRMAEGLEKRVIAEGVETAEQAEFLIRTGCYGIQGYLYGRPMPAAQFGMTLAERQRADVRVAG